MCNAVERVCCQRSGRVRHRHEYLMGLQERNERLFYRVLHENTQELLPIIDLPTVGAFCESYGLMFRAAPRGLYISLKDKGAHYLHPPVDRAGNTCFVTQPTASCSNHPLKEPGPTSL